MSRYTLGKCVCIGLIVFGRLLPLPWSLFLALT
jgi:hypothetical protein